MQAGGMANSAVSTVFLPLAERYGFAAVFTALGVHVLVMTLMIAVWVPETANQGLEHIESLIQSRSNARECITKEADQVDVHGDENTSEAVDSRQREIGLGSHLLANDGA
jgi:hypothetical protein